MKKILLVQTSFLGDTILSTPVVSGIQKLHPGAELWMMTTPLAAPLVSGDPLLAGVIPMEKRGRYKGLRGLLRMRQKIAGMKFDMVYSLHRSFRTSLLLWLSGIPARIGFDNAKLGFLYHKRSRRNPSDHDVLRNLSLLTPEIPLESLDKEMRLFAPPSEAVSADILDALPEPGGYALLVPGSAWKTKMWDSSEFREVAKHLLSKGVPVMLVGAPADREASRKVARGLDLLDLTGKTTLSETLYITKNARIVICNDSMALHMASAFKVPNVAVFCATCPSFGFTPWRNRAAVVEHEGLSCKPCSRHGQQKCPNNTEACMHNLTPRVVEAAEKLMGIR